MSYLSYLKNGHIRLFLSDFEIHSSADGFQSSTHTTKNLRAVEITENNSRVSKIISNNINMTGLSKQVDVCASKTLTLSLVFHAVYFLVSVHRKV